MAHPRSSPNQPQIRKAPASQVIPAVLIALLSLTLALPTAFFGGALLFYQSRQLIAPGVTCAGMDLGNQTLTDAIQKIDRAWNLDRKITLSNEEQHWETTPGFLGIWVDPGSTVQKAYAIGRGPNGLEDLARLLYTHRREIELVVNFNAQAARDQLTHWSAQIGHPSQAASLTLQGEQVVVTPGQAGVTIDVEKTVSQIAANPKKALFSGEVTLSMQAIPADTTHADQAAAEAQKLIDRPLRLTLYDPITDQRSEWQAPRSLVAAWVRIAGSPEGYQVSFADDQLIDFVASLPAHPDAIGLAEDLELPAIADPQTIASQMLAGESPLLLLRHKPRTYITQVGDTLFSIGWKMGIPYWRMMKANPSYGSGGLAAGVEIVVPSPNDLLPEPVVLNKRIVISIAQQHMWVYQDGAQIRDFVISTGIPNSPTQPGVFQVQTHELNAYAENWALWMPHWMGIYEAWPGFMNGIHGLPVLSNGVRLWKNVLGSPASYGCIILDLPEAEWLYNWAENGVVVEIKA